MLVLVLEIGLRDCLLKVSAVRNMLRPKKDSKGVRICSGEADGFHRPPWLAAGDCLGPAGGLCPWLIVALNAGCQCFQCGNVVAWSNAGLEGWAFPHLKFFGGRGCMLVARMSRRRRRPWCFNL